MAPKIIPISPFLESEPNQFGEVESNTIGIPMNVNVFQQPMTPDTDDKEAAAACRDFFVLLRDEMVKMQATHVPPVFALNGYTQATLGLINQTLGEGEVSIQISETGTDAYDQIRAVESVFIGVWRVQYFKGGKAVADEIECGPLPHSVLESARRTANRTIPEDIAFPEDAMNSPAVLAELRQVLKTWKDGDEPFAINLSHLPISQSDIKLINETLGSGCVVIVSKGFGNCTILSSRVPNVWFVQYYNSVNTNRMILNTIAVTTLPDEALASMDDIADSAKRVTEYIDWLTESWEIAPKN